MGTVVTLITLLVVLLSGLTAGLGRGNTSAITDLPADHLVLSAPADGRSCLHRLVPPALRAGRLVPRTRRPAGRAGHPQHDQRWGRRTHRRCRPLRRPARLQAGSPKSAPAEVVLSTKAADALEVAAGDRIELAGQPVTIARSLGTTSSPTHPSSGQPTTNAPRLRPEAGQRDIPRPDHQRNDKRRPRRGRPTTRHAHPHPGRVAVGHRLLHLRERLAAADAGPPVRDLRPGHRRVLHRLDHPAQRRHRRPQGPRRLHRLPAQGRPRPGAGPARPRRRPRHRPSPPASAPLVASPAQPCPSCSTRPPCCSPPP